MLAISVRSPHHLEARDVPAPERPGPEEVLLKTARAGICGSDIHILHGSNPFARYPRIITF